MTEYLYPTKEIEDFLLESGYETEAFMIRIEEEKKDE
jgi:hypothetical protein